MDAIMVTAMAYTVMSSDDRRPVYVAAPQAVVTLAAPVTYPDKFCAVIFNANILADIEIASSATIKTKLTSVRKMALGANTKLVLKLEDGAWSRKESCDE